MPNPKEILHAYLDFYPYIDHYYGLTMWADMTATAESRTRPNVQSVDRAVRILTMLAGNPFPVGVAELASRLNLSTTSVHRMLTTLAALGWVEQNTRTSRYRL